jgi:hypothetical protein
MNTSAPTPEGLVVIEKPRENDDFIVEEIGKLEQVIYRYVTKRTIIEDGTELLAIQRDPRFLLERISEIEAHCEELTQNVPTPIELPLWRWNRKAAHRRFDG